MATILFYEKPGCSSNTRQKQLLRAAGAALEVHNLLTEAWTPARLHEFFAGKPVTDWFNRNAPDVKSGAVNPAAMDADSALNAMLANPLLIRRPLIATGTFRCSGFDWPALAEQLCLPIPVENTISGNAIDLEACKHHATATHPTPGSCRSAGGDA